VIALTGLKGLKGAGVEAGRRIGVKPAREPLSWWIGYQGSVMPTRANGHSETHPWLNAGLYTGLNQLHPRLWLALRLLHGLWAVAGVLCFLVWLLFFSGRVLAARDRERNAPERAAVLRM
jgi:hypothetical protein